MSTRAMKSSRVAALCVLLTMSAFQNACPQEPAAAQPAAPQAPAAPAEAFDPMDSLLEFGTTDTDQAATGETNALQLIVQESSNIRDPFWPVGFEPPKPKKPTDPVVEQVVAPVVEEAPRWEDAMKELSVKGIMNVGGGRFMAVVNEQVVGENDIVSVSFGTRRYTWRINSISAQGVKFQKMTSTR